MMMVIVYNETLEQELRRKYKIPSRIKTEDIWRYIGEVKAHEILEKVREKLSNNSKED